MFIKNKKPIKIIGYPESSMTQEYVEVFKKENLSNFEIILPDDFILLKNKNQFQYIIGFSLDIKLRRKICDIIDDFNLDCVTYICDSVYMFPSSIVGKGCFISHQTIIYWSVLIKDHCFLGFRSGVGHDCTIGKNTIVSPGVDIAGKVNVGENCKFLFRSSVINKINICDDVILGAFSNLKKDALKPGNYIGTIAKHYNKNK